MPLCNLSETVHASWTRQSGKQRDNIYEEIVDDFARAFIQCTRYNAFLTSRASGTSPTKEELRLRAASRSGNLSSIFKAMEKLLGSCHFLIKVPLYAGEEVFGSAKRRLHVESGANNDSHRFDKIKFSHPKAATKALRTSLHDSPSASAKHDLEADIPTILVENQTSNVTESVHHVTGVQESDCDVQQWQIRRVPFVGKKVCFAMQTRIGRKYIQKLPLSILAPAYFGVLHV
jgi:hypothetical protein